MPLSSHSCDDPGIRISQEIFADYVLTALKSSLNSIVGSMFCDCCHYVETRLKTNKI